MPSFLLQEFCKLLFYITPLYVYNNYIMDKLITLNKPINHVAFIMDGNGRWAKKRGLPRHLGHKEGCNRIIDVVKVCKKYDIKVCSFYAFSTENWNRPQDEIDHLFDYLEYFFKKEVKELLKNDTRIIISGDLSRLPEKTRNVCLEAIDTTKDCKTYVMNICLNYGSRDEITKATKEIANLVKQNELKVEDITPEVISSHLYTKGLPDVDLMIRTSGEERLSNYLLWQNAYAEFVFTDTYWPDFKQAEFEKCLIEYNNRNRRFGGLANEEK